MRIFVERVVEHGGDKFSKESVTSFEADILPVGIRDDLWVDTGGKRERHTVIDILMAIDTRGEFAIIEIGRPSVRREIWLSSRGDTDREPDQLA